MTQKKFLTAEWRNLIMANYVVDPAILKTYLPTKTELDGWNGKYYVSLVGFMFQQVRVFGLKIPLHVNFPEVNLRFYVRYKDANGTWKRGVVFINEIVPKRAISFIANRIFNENYKCLPMQSYHDIAGDQLSIKYSWKYKAEWNSIRFDAIEPAGTLLANSEEEFITEHFWGYTKIDNKRTAEYHVEHPRWKVYKPDFYQIHCDFKNLYGRPFADMSDRQPDSVFMAEGSPIAVYMKKII